MKWYHALQLCLSFIILGVLMQQGDRMSLAVIYFLFSVFCLVVALVKIKAELRGEGREGP